MVIKHIIIHCSATRLSQSYTFARCQDDHVYNRHFVDIGYHYYIEQDGSLHQGRPEWKMGAHCTGHNCTSLGVCYEGGLDRNARPADTRTYEQRQTLLRLLTELRQRYPGAVIVGHRDLNPTKACPCFDAKKEYRNL